MPVEPTESPRLETQVRLEMDGISKRYGAVKALTDAQFELRAGEVMALLGENGAGKSTLVKILSGLVRQDEGEIHIDGQPVDINTSHRSQAAGLAVVQQEYSSVRPMTVAENLRLGQTSAGFVWWPPRLRREAREVLDHVGLEHIDPKTPVDELSVAEMQLLEIARLLARDARILIFDEPTAALADAEIERVLQVVRRLADQGRSVIYVTHRLPEVFRIADRVTVLRNGKSQPPVATAHLDVDAVVTMMLGRDLGTMFPNRAGPTDRVLLEVDELVVPGLASPVSFKVHAGEILGLTGQLGSGANAAVQGVAGVLPVLGGTVRLNGEELPLHNRAAGIRRGVAYCSSDRKRDGAFAGVSILRNLSSPWLGSVSQGGWVSIRAEREQAAESCREFAIDVRRLGSPLGTLSGGNQQKVALGKWLGTRPSVLLVEEPTRGVDVGARAEIYTQLRSLCDAGLGVILCSSDTAEIFGVSDTIATFYKGRLTATRPHDKWTGQELVREAIHTEVA